MGQRKAPSGFAPAAAQIQKVYQSTLNEGFRGMFILVAACSAFGLIVLMGYKDTAPRRAAPQAEAPVGAGLEPAVEGEELAFGLTAPGLSLGAEAFYEVA